MNSAQMSLKHTCSVLVNTIVRMLMFQPTIVKVVTESVSAKNRKFHAFVILKTSHHGLAYNFLRRSIEEGYTIYVVQYLLIRNPNDNCWRMLDVKQIIQRENLGHK